MEYRHIGESGLVASEIGLGASNFGLGLTESASEDVFRAALDAGVTFVDTSDSYGRSEDVLGGLLAGVRDDLVIATKFGSDVRRHGHDNGTDWGARGARRYLVRSVEASLRRLRTDRIDLYQMHRPDPRTPVEETLDCLDDLVRQGKVLYVGHSNFNGWQLSHAEWTARTRGTVRFLSAQNEYSLLERAIEDEVLPAITTYRMGLLAYFPLASGLLTGRYRRGEAPPDNSRIKRWGAEAVLTDAVFDTLEGLEVFAAARGIPLASIALGWLLARPGVASVITGASSAAQARANLAAPPWRPTEDELTELDRICATRSHGTSLAFTGGITRA